MAVLCRTYVLYIVVSICEDRFKCQEDEYRIGVREGCNVTSTSSTHVGLKQVKDV
jgi:hypothetical protein